MWHALNERWEGFSKEQKISVVLLGICGLLAMGLSLYRIQGNVTRPFLVDQQQIVDAKKLIGETPEQEEARLRRTDTDGDTISDWDETYVTKTNPNLRDSCGKGMPDNVWLATGGTGDCAAGGGGSNEGSTTVGQPSSQSALSPFDFGTNPAATSTSSNQTSQDLQTLLPRNPDEIRAALQGQVDQEKLDALTDEELLELYDQAISIQANQDAGSTTTTSTP